VVGGPQQRAANTALDTLAAWAKTSGREKVAAVAEHYAAQSLLGVTLALPGPTGERNTLRFAPRGAIVCHAATQNGLLNQLAAVLATGNQAVIVPQSAKNAGEIVPVDLPSAIKGHIAAVGALESFKGDFQLALVESPLVAAVREPMAARDGALVGIIETDDSGAIPLWRLLAERALCVNTTAAGGNASLMTLGA
jgi:RHH-type proline utilization regulon transcriptional repressor/proline dehydrogenase/delta 1-pyrroline-5-carboxylate dehydrogenase